MSTTDHRIQLEAEDACDELPDSLQQCDDFHQLDKKSPLYAVVHDILLKNAALKLQVEKLQTSEGNGYGFTAKSLQEQVQKLTQLVQALEGKNKVLAEEALEKELAFKKLEETLKCNPTEEKIFTSKITSLTNELSQQSVTVSELAKKVSKLVDENKELKETERELRLSLELAANGQQSAER